MPVIDGFYRTIYKRMGHGRGFCEPRQQGAQSFAKCSVGTVGDQPDGAHGSMRSSSRRVEVMPPTIRRTCRP
jgi:hypothetical protein